MAYPHPLIRFRENNRHIVRGATFDDRVSRFRLIHQEDETQKVILDYTDLLNGATISSVTVTDDSITASQATSGGQITLTLSAIGKGYGDVDVSVTFSDGRIRVEKLRLEQPFAGVQDDYGSVRM